MGYSTEEDQKAAYILSNLIKRKFLDSKILDKKIRGKQVLAIGAGPNLDLYTSFIKKNRSFVKIVADGAVKFLIENNIKPDIVVTDLDGDLRFLVKAEKLGAIMVIHAHSDNVDLIRKYISKFRKIIGTTQVMPVEHVYNFGGFTDGDRCVFLAEEFGAKDIVLVGMLFDDSIGQYSKAIIDNVEVKREKLQIAKRLLQVLAKNTKSNLFDTSKKPIIGFKYFKITS
ncbi:MAG TPA: 6-hydroxymethylpterin diphosphokinase MptE-like protein [Nitrososphaeraceae archaeon]|jgi:2-amino-4-hydroxy-6-hydroxymethyldihydropteridine diphosphokinase|nr:6-hydroxymethylpterin diphosphokinase MptE-like protein [Nitrososphaeraceae archaeon]